MIRSISSAQLSYKTLFLQNALPQNILDEAMEALNDSKESPKPSPAKELGEAGGVAVKEGTTLFFPTRLICTCRERQRSRYNVCKCKRAGNTTKRATMARRYVVQRS